MKQSSVFADTCHSYVKQIQQIDFLARAELLGLKRDGESLVIPLYDAVYSVSAQGISENGGGEITPAVQVMICKYILTYATETPGVIDKFVTYREFKDSGPLTSYFTNNTNKIIETTFSGNVDLMKERALRLGGELLSSATYDVSFRFYAFPKIPVVLNFNDADDLFPAQCSVLYRSTAASYLDMESLSMTGTLLTGKLITP